MDNIELLEADASVADVIDDGTKVTIDNAIEAVEDAEEEITVGDAMDDGELIDNVALGVKMPDAETIKFADSQEEDDNMIKVVKDGEQDPEDAMYEREYPELHNDDPNDDGDDITEEDFEAIDVDESYVSNSIVDIVLEAKEELANDNNQEG